MGDVNDPMQLSPEDLVKGLLPQEFIPVNHGCVLSADPSSDARYCSWSLDGHCQVPTINFGLLGAGRRKSLACRSYLTLNLKEIVAPRLAEEDCHITQTIDSLIREFIGKSMEKFWHGGCRMIYQVESSGSQEINSVLTRY